MSLPDDQDDDFDRDYCPICGSEMEYVDCWNCHGEGGFHNCGEDCCCCLHPESDLNEACGECDGEGGYRQCMALPHTKEQMDAYSRLQDQDDAQRSGGH